MVAHLQCFPIGLKAMNSIPLHVAMCTQYNLM